VMAVASCSELYRWLESSGVAAKPAIDLVNCYNRVTPRCGC
jgi:hypothetical protein